MIIGQNTLNLNFRQFTPPEWQILKPNFFNTSETSPKIHWKFKLNTLPTEQLPIANWLCHVPPKNLLVPKPSDAMAINISPLQNNLTLPRNMLPLPSISLYLMSLHQKRRNLYCFQAQNHHRNHENASWRVLTQEIPKETNFASKITGRLPSRVVEHYLTGSRWVSSNREVLKTHPKATSQPPALEVGLSSFSVSISSRVPIPSSEIIFFSDLACSLQ